MKYKFSIDFDKESDLWNWLDAVEYGKSYGFNWRDNLRSADDIQTYDRALSLTKTKRKDLLSKYLDNKYQSNRLIFSKYMEFINKIYNIKFEDACNKLQEITNRKLFFNEYTIHLTTFPRCPYDDQKGTLFTRFNDSEVIGTFMHEVLHFQFHRYWYENLDSPVSKLSEEHFHYLKESLTVVLDNSIVPLIEIYDRGYESHAEFRKILHEYWDKCHDFDKLVEYGLKKLPEFIE